MNFKKGISGFKERFEIIYYTKQNAIKCTEDSPKLNLKNLSWEEFDLLQLNKSNRINPITDLSPPVSLPSACSNLSNDFDSESNASTSVSTSASSSASTSVSTSASTLNLSASSSSYLKNRKQQKKNFGQSIQIRLLMNQLKEGYQ